MKHNKCPICRLRNFSLKKLYSLFFFNFILAITDSLMIENENKLNNSFSKEKTEENKEDKEEDKN